MKQNNPPLRRQIGQKNAFSFIKKNAIFIFLFLALFIPNVDATLMQHNLFNGDLSDVLGNYPMQGSNVEYRNNSIYFNQTTSILNISGIDSSHPLTGDDSDSYSVNFWYKIDTLPSTDSFLYVRCQENTGEFQPLVFVTPTGGIEARVTRSGGASYIVNSDNLPIGGYNMVTITYNGSSKYLKIYTNSSFDAEVLYQGGGANPNSANICFTPSGAYPYNGLYDNLKMYNHVLNDTEITALYDLGQDQKVNFTISLNDLYNSSSILNFTAEIDGATYISNTTTGVLTTPIQVSDGLLKNITIGANNYINNTIINYNTSIALSSNLTYYRSRHLVNATIAPLNTTLINTFNVSAGGILWNTTTGSVIVETAWNTSTLMTWMANNFQTLTYTTNGSQNEAYQFNAYTKNSFDLVFWDEINNSIIGQLVDLQLISDVTGGNYSTTNGTMYIDLLSPAEYVLRYSSAGYSTRNYYLTLVEGSYNQLNLYLLNASKTVNVTATVITTLNEELEGATINVQRYFTDQNIYKTVEKVNTNYEGKAIIHVTNDEFYKFTVDYNGSTVLSTSPTYILEDAITLVVDTGADPTTRFFETHGVSHTLTYLNDTYQFRYVFSDPDLVTSQACLKVYTTDDIRGETLYNQTCVTSTSATMIQNIANTNGTTYVAYATVTIDGDEVVLDKIIAVFKDDSQFGNEGILIIVFAMIVFASIAIWNPFVALILTPLPLLFGAMANIIPLGTSLIIGVIIAVVFIAFYIGGKS